MTHFEFDTVVNKSVKMTPMNLLFPKEIIDELRELDICEGMCYSNAVLVAKKLEEKGYDVDVVEGFYRCNKKACTHFSRVYDFGSCEWIEHRWCKIGNYYFDPTYFLGKDICMGSSYFDYKAQRLYYADDLIAFAHQVSDDFDVKNRTEKDRLWCSSLNGSRSIDGGETIVYLAKIDDDFSYVKIAS